VHDDRIELIALNHADVEESGVFAVHRVVHDAALAIAMILRRLDKADRRVVEKRHKVLEPVGLHHVVSVNDADHLGIRGRMRQSETQCACLEASEVVVTHKFEAVAE
jgi:hypothetical protein